MEKVSTVLVTNEAELAHSTLALEVRLLALRSFAKLLAEEAFLATTCCESVGTGTSCFPFTVSLVLAPAKLAVIECSLPVKARVFELEGLTSVSF